MADVIQKIQTFNKGRVPEFLQMKYAFMKQDIFRFFRGTCHLFYQDLSKNINWKDNTKCWISGDLHLENFGTYKGDDRIVYFDMNDFDEALLAPATWEGARFLTSIYVASHVVGYNKKKAQELAKRSVAIYVSALQKGKALSIDKETAGGLLKYFLEQLKQRKENAFVLSKIIFKKKNTRLIIDNIKTFKVASDEKKKMIVRFNKWLEKNLVEKKYRVIDLAYRVVGTGSVGIIRYVVLVREKGTKNFRLIDVKEALPSSVKPFVKTIQPKWKNEAARVTTLQKRVQYVPPALLDGFTMDKKSFVIKELQPTQDRMDLSLCKGKLKKLSAILVTMGEVAAWGQLRSAGTQGSSSVEELIDFADQHKNIEKALLDYARQYSKQVMNDYEEFCKGYKKLIIETK
jgi:uncharacterized protein (DUF2252 family)